MTPIAQYQLQPGDILVFSRRTLYNLVIMLKTWSMATHTEVYIGDGRTIASRNGKGCANYPLDLDGIYRVLRPVIPFDLKSGIADFNSKYNGKPYGWLALFSFCLIDLHDNGLFCSELTTLFMRGCGLDLFNRTIEANIVAPADMDYIHESVAKIVFQA